MICFSTKESDYSALQAVLHLTFLGKIAEEKNVGKKLKASENSFVEP